MKTTLGHYLTQGNRDFPIDAETFDYIQQNQALLCVLGNIAGDKAVLYGCEPEQGGAGRRAGYVFLRTKDFPEGEILCWEGGSVAAGMYLKKETVPVAAQGYEYPQAYTTRSLAAGIGEENYDWGEMKQIATIPQLERTIASLRTQLDALAPPPLGIVQMWAGKTVPEGYELCEGQQLKTTDYPELYKVLGTTFNNAYSATGSRYSTSGGYFRLPDLRGRFVVGHNPSDADYSSYGKAGGEKKHTLTVAEMPAHDHGQNLWAEGNGDWKSGGSNSSPNSTSQHNGTTPFGKTDKTGGSSPHENRPPYYVLAYIMRVR